MTTGVRRRVIGGMTLSEAIRKYSPCVVWRAGAQELGHSLPPNLPCIIDARHIKIDEQHLVDQVLEQVNRKTFNRWSSAPVIVVL